jgi:raffinose/stachyose/melibiose transport system permease protein
VKRAYSRKAFRYSLRVLARQGAPRRSTSNGGVFRYTAGVLLREVLLVLSAVVFAIPFFLLVVQSLKSNLETLVSPNSLPAHPNWSNYSVAWGAGMGSALLTSALITTASVVSLVVLGSLCAYTLARHVSRFSTGLYLLFILGIILPFQLAIVPIYVAMRSVQLTGTVVGMIILYTGLLMPLSVFLYTGFIRALPRDYEDAAYVDGATFWTMFRFVVFPLLRPITGTVAVVTGLFIWNDFFASLVFLQGSDHKTLPVAIYSFAYDYESQWNLIFAAVGIAVAPVLVVFVLAQRQMMHGFSGGIRG